MCFSIFDLKKNTIVHTFVGQNIYNESEVFIHPLIYSFYWIYSFSLAGYRSSWNARTRWTFVHAPGLRCLQSSVVVAGATASRQTKRSVWVSFREKTKRNFPQPGGFQPELELELHSVSLFEVVANKKMGPWKTFRNQRIRKGIPARQLWTQVLLLTHFLQPMVYIKLSTFFRSLNSDSETLSRNDENSDSLHGLAEKSHNEFLLHAVRFESYLTGFFRKAGVLEPSFLFFWPFKQQTIVHKSNWIMTVVWSFK